MGGVLVAKGKSRKEFEREEREVTWYDALGRSEFNSLKKMFVTNFRDELFEVVSEP